MKICKYGITLSLLGEEDIEFVSEKLTAMEVQFHGIHTEETTAQELQKKFVSMPDLKNLYYIIEHKDVKIGLISETNQNWQTRSSQLEMLIWDESLAQSHIPTLALLCLLGNGFNYLNWNSFTCQSADVKTIELLEKLGFSSTGKEKQLEIGSERFENEAAKIIQELQTDMDEKSGEEYLLLESGDYKTGIARHIEEHFLETGIYLYRRGIKGDRMYFR